MFGGFSGAAALRFFLFCTLILSASVEANLQCASTLLLGAQVDSANQKITFRVYSKNATHMEVLLFDAPQATEKISKALSLDKGTSIWSASVSFSELKQAGWKITEPLPTSFQYPYYAYRAWGPNWPKGKLVGKDFDDRGNRFNPNKALLDPYALEVSHDARTMPAQTEAPYFTGKNRQISSIERAPKGLIFPFPSGATGVRPTRAFKDEVIYEMHVRGMTMKAPGIADSDRGTFKGIQAAIPYFKELGVTAIELLPVFEFQDDANQEASTEGNNFWGYDPINYFSPNRRFVSSTNTSRPGGATEEFVQMAEALHKAGLKLYLDVVFNHTAEGGNQKNPEDAKLLSWRGLDNATYYQVGKDGSDFQDNSGCGANVNTANETVRQLVMDSLKYWKHLGVDGFRFDLASVLGNEVESGYDFRFDKMNPKNILNRAISELPGRSEAGGEGMDLIAEPWGVGAGTYQIGQFPYHPSTSAGFAEWNGKFRDTLRRAENKWSVDSPTPAEIATRLAGSEDLFAHGKRGPGFSVNYVVSHDGFPLKDLVSYNQKNNQQGYPFGPTDGGDDHNISWDHSNPGDTPAETQARQRQGARNLMALSLLAYGGVPMFFAGDELLRTQGGNNNAYKIDNAANWFPWPATASDSLSDSVLSARKNPFFLLTRNLISFRLAHASLRPARHASGTDSDGNGLRDLSWFQANGKSAEDRDLPDSEKGYMHDADNGFLAYRIDAEEHGETGTRSIFVAYNWSHRTTALRLPPAAAGKKWYWVGDTDSKYESQGNFVAPGKERSFEEAFPNSFGKYSMTGRSVAVFIEK